MTDNEVRDAVRKLETERGHVVTSVHLGLSVNTLRKLRLNEPVTPRTLARVRARLPELGIEIER